jgi:hypothetical protein
MAADLMSTGAVVVYGAGRRASDEVARSACGAASAGGQVTLAVAVIVVCVGWRLAYTRGCPRASPAVDRSVMAGRACQSRVAA